LACAGCGRTAGKSLETNPEFQQIKASLEESQRQRTQLEQDASRLKAALAEAEKAKGSLDVQVKELTKSRNDLDAQVKELTKSRGNLDAQVKDLTKSRGDLEGKVADLGKARVTLETRVNDLQKTVDGLTKARDVAVADARSAQANADTLNDKLKAQTKQIADLQEQIKMIRAALGQLQQKLD